MTEDVDEMMAQYLSNAIRAGATGGPVPPPPAALTLALSKLTGYEVASRVLPNAATRLHYRALNAGQSPATAAVRRTGNSR